MSSSRRELVGQIGPHDVMLGRGAPISENEGNTRLRQSVVLRHADYAQATDRNTKHRVAIEIIETVLQNGGRFLQKATDIETDKFDGVWEVVKAPNEVIMRKVKQLLRDMAPQARERRAERKRLTRKRPPEREGQSSETSDTSEARAFASAAPNGPLERAPLFSEESKAASSTATGAAAAASTVPPTIPPTVSQQATPGIRRTFALPSFVSARFPSPPTATRDLTQHPLLTGLGNAQQSTTLRPGEREALLSMLLSTRTQSSQLDQLPPQAPVDPLGLNSLPSRRAVANTFQQPEPQQLEHLAALLQSRGELGQRLQQQLFQQQQTQQLHRGFSPVRQSVSQQQHQQPVSQAIDPRRSQLLTLLRSQHAPAAAATPARNSAATNPMSLNAALLGASSPLSLSSFLHQDTSQSVAATSSSPSSPVDLSLALLLLRQQQRQHQQQRHEQKQREER